MSARRLIALAATVWVVAVGYSARAQQGTESPTATAREASAAAGAAAPENSDCLMCHGDDSAVRSDGRPVVVGPELFEKSIHGSMSCVDCHADPAATELPHPETLAKVDCSMCHSDAVEKFHDGVHGRTTPDGAHVATCADCHGIHDILPSSNRQSRTYHLNIVATCSRCHSDPALTAAAGLPADLTETFADSIHGRALSRSGLVVAPTCSGCHGAHDIYSPTDPRSRVSSANVPATCGTCHEGIAHQFSGGVHAAVIAGGDLGAPDCQTCHSAHAIQRSDSTAWQLSVIGQCGTCHADRLATFKDTFHGQVTSLGFRAVAGCADCHGAHEVLPASDPRSPIAPENLVQTCGKCHAYANANFVKYDPHADKHDRARSPALFYVSKFMTVLLAGVFGFFGIHTALWFSKELQLLKTGRAAASRQGERPKKRTPDETQGGAAAGAPEDADDRAD